MINIVYIINMSKLKPNHVSKPQIEFNILQSNYKKYLKVILDKCQ